MFVKLTVEYRWAGETWPTGHHLELPADEAAALIEDGHAIPAVCDRDLARETR